MKTMQIETESTISENHIATTSALASKSDASEQFRMIMKQCRADIKQRRMDIGKGIKFTSDATIVRMMVCFGILIAFVDTLIQS